MKHIHNRNVYDTETAEQIAQTVLNHSRRETLYKTDEGEYFIYREEWSREQFVIVYDEMEPAVTSLTPISEEQALNWCERNEVSVDLIWDEFRHLIET